MEELGCFDWFSEVGACAYSRELFDFLRRGVSTDHDDRDTPGCVRSAIAKAHPILADQEAQDRVRPNRVNAGAPNQGRSVPPLR